MVGKGSQMETEKTIDLTLITGAGATRDLGVAGDRFPLMGDWSKSLSDHLVSKGSSFLDVTDLKDVNSGEEFERRLGDYLRRVQAFKQIEPLLAHTTNFPTVPTTLRGATTLKEWFDQSNHTFDQINHAILESLYREFADRRHDSTQAHHSYGKLLDALSISRNRSKWVYASTNYDRIGEETIAGLGYGIDDGTKAIFGVHEFDVDMMVESLSRDSCQCCIFTGGLVGTAATTESPTVRIRIGTSKTQVRRY